MAHLKNLLLVSKRNRIEFIAIGFAHSAFLISNSNYLKKITDGIVLLGYLGNDQNTRQEKDSVDNFTYSDITGRHIVKGVKIHAYIIGKILNEYNRSKK